MAASPEERNANCLEYTYLLMDFLRSAGIEANSTFINDTLYSNHVAVIARLDGEKYELDAAMLRFGKTEKSGASDRKSTAQHYFNVGTILMKRENLEEAVAVFNEGLEIDPDAINLWNNLGGALYAMGVRQGGPAAEALFEASLSARQNAAKIGPHCVFIWKNIAVVQEALGRQDEAEAANRKASEVQVKNREARLKKKAEEEEAHNRKMEAFFARVDAANRERLAV